MEKKEIPKPLPICPLCNSEMFVETYHGYYDSFSYWRCNCDDGLLDNYSTRSWNSVP